MAASAAGRAAAARPDRAARPCSAPIIAGIAQLQLIQSTELPDDQADRISGTYKGLATRVSADDPRCPTARTGTLELGDNRLELAYTPRPDLHRAGAAGRQRGQCGGAIQAAGANRQRLCHLHRHHAELHHAVRLPLRDLRTAPPAGGLGREGHRAPWLSKNDAAGCPACWAARRIRRCCRTRCPRRPHRCSPARRWSCCSAPPAAPRRPAHDDADSARSASDGAPLRTAPPPGTAAYAPPPEAVAVARPADRRLAGQPRPCPRRRCKLRIVAHIANRGDMVTGLDAWAGERGSGLQLEGLAVTPIEGIDPDDLEYQAMLHDGSLTAWHRDAAFCGTRGGILPLRGFALRLVGDAAATHRISYAAVFVDGAQVGPVGDGGAVRRRQRGWAGGRSM